MLYESELDEKWMPCTGPVFRISREPCYSSVENRGERVALTTESWVGFKRLLGQLGPSEEEALKKLDKYAKLFQLLRGSGYVSL
ncbi:MAG: hypothetical protein QXK88_10870 [Desulfurococcaceae archaeon]